MGIEGIENVAGHSDPGDETSDPVPAPPIEDPAQTDAPGEEPAEETTPANPGGSNAEH